MKTKIVNLLGKPLKLMRNVEDGSFVLFPTNTSYAVSDATVDDVEPVQVDELVIGVNITSLSVPTPERDTLFIVPQYVAMSQNRDDLLYPVDVEESENGKGFICDSLSFSKMQKLDGLDGSVETVTKVMEQQNESSTKNTPPRV